MILSLDTWLDQNLLVVKSEGMCALSHLPDGPLTSLSNAYSPCSGDEVQSSRPSTILVSMVCLICQIAASTTMCERSLVPSFMIRSWWDLDSPGDRNNPLARRYLGIRIPATITTAAQNSLDLNSGCLPGDTWALAVPSVLRGTPATYAQKPRLLPQCGRQDWLPGVGFLPR